MDLTYGRICFREFLQEDFPLFYSVFSNEQVMRYAWIDKFNSEKEAIPLFEDFLNIDDKPNRKNSYAFAVFSCEDKSFMGFADIELHSFNSSGGVGEVGYFLLPEFWGKGYATEVAGAMTEFGFSELKLHKVCARCNSNNLKSEKVMIKNGMRKEGELRKVRYKNGSWDDEKHYGILLEEWVLRKS